MYMSCKPTVRARIFVNEASDMPRRHASIIFLLSVATHAAVVVAAVDHSNIFGSAALFLEL